MSQLNNAYQQTFHYNENESYFDGAHPSHIGNASFPAWPHQAPRAMGNTLPSLSPSVLSSRTATGLMTARMNWAQPMPIDSNINSTLPNASLLAPPRTSRPRTSLDSVSNVDPISRFYNHDAPWSSQNPRSSSIGSAHPYFPQSSLGYGLCRDGPGSDIGSTTNRSDSGYVTHHAHSVISNDPERFDLELPSEMTLRVDNLNVNSASSDSIDIFHVTSTDRTSQYSGKSTKSSKALRCEHCKEISKCKSDHKKHMLKHVKPFKCDIPKCRRGDKGFTTENDLVRHRKSVHGIGMLTNSYQCASDTCRNREKIWPRLDNFKQHIHRMHHDDDENDLIRRSVYEHQKPSPASQSPSVAPMDTTLAVAGIGTEKQFSGNEFDDPVSVISLTPDQDTSNWNTIDPSSHEFSLDVDQTSPTNYAQSSRKDSGYRFQERSAPYDLSMSPARRDENLKRLDTLATIASSQSLDKACSLPPVQLSNAPQTKAEQQRQALQKFSRMIAQGIKSSPGGENMDLEEVVMRALSGATNPSKKVQSSPHFTGRSPMDPNLCSDAEYDMLTKGEVRQASQAISNLTKQSGKPSPTRSRPSPTKGFLSNKLPCERCDTVLARSCDMRKHMKRHTRPYGCTYPKCHKRFGAKSDWKRHEKSQHFQLESFRCQLPFPCQDPFPSSQTPCGELFHRAEMFTAHLQSYHRIQQAEQLEHEVKMRRIGKNGQGQFWCGFCEDIVKLDKKRNAAWDERFDHIDRHFCTENRGIEEWLCVEAKKTKGEMAREVDKLAFDDGEQEDEEEDHGGDVSRDKDERVSTSRTQKSSTLASSKMEKQLSSTSSNPRKRQAEATEPTTSSVPSPHPPQKRARRDVVRYCCSCQSGPWAQHIYVDCMSCSHHLCSSCTVVGGTTNIDDVITSMS